MHIIKFQYTSLEMILLNIFLLVQYSSFVLILAGIACGNGTVASSIASLGDNDDAFAGASGASGASAAASAAATAASSAGAASAGVYGHGK